MQQTMEFKLDKEWWAEKNVKGKDINDIKELLCRDGDELEVMWKVEVIFELVTPPHLILTSLKTEWKR